MHKKRVVKKMIYCFDLDGTLCTNKSDDYNIAEPIIDRIKKVNKLYDEGHTIFIDSARGSITKIDWQKVTEKQLKKWGLKYHVIRTGNKMFADYYIDDKAISDLNFFKNI